MLSLTRREFVCNATAAGLAIGAAGPALAHAADADKPLIVDAHTHFYDPSRSQGVPWPAKDNKLLYRTVLPSDFLRVAGPHGVSKTIVVEASPLLEDNQWILDLAERETSIVGFVGHLVPGTPDFVAQLKRFAKNSLYRGIRVNGTQLAAGLDDPNYRRDLAELADHDLELDVNGGPTLLPAVERLARELSALRIVINHVANLKIDGREPPADWRAGIESAAKRPQVYCKVSALAENTGAKAGDATRDVDFYRPVLDALWNAFGEDRLIYGSNWPVSDRGAPYGVVMGIVREYFGSKGATAAAKYFSGNARAAYKWVTR